MVKSASSHDPHWNCCFSVSKYCSVSILVNTAEIQHSSVFTHEPPKTRFQGRGDPAEMSHNLVYLRPPCSWRVYQSTHSLHEPHTFQGCNLSVSTSSCTSLASTLREDPLSRLPCAHACVHSPLDSRKHCEPCDSRWATLVAGGPDEGPFRFPRQYPACMHLTSGGCPFLGCRFDDGVAHPVLHFGLFC